MLLLIDILSSKLAVFYGLWSKHVLEWWKHKDDSNVLFLKYEDLKKVIAITCCVTLICNLAKFAQTMCLKRESCPIL